MARAKQTARSEARRRNRAANRVAPDVPDGDGEDEPIESTAAVGGTATTSARSGSGLAPGGSVFGRLSGSLRLSYHPPKVREDLAAWQTWLLSLSTLAGVGLIVGSGLAFVAFPGYSGSSLAFQYFVYPPPVGSIFIAGFFAPRASYLIGALLGVLDAAVLLALTAQGVLPNAYVLYAIALIPLDALFAGGIAYYRRFLASTTPRKPAPKRGSGSKSRPTAKPATRR